MSVLLSLVYAYIVVWLWFVVCYDMHDVDYDGVNFELLCCTHTIIFVIIV